MMKAYEVEFSTIEEIYDANEKVRARLLAVVSDLSDEQAELRTEKGDWTVEAVVEHLAKVEEGMVKIASRLLSKAAEAGKTSDGSARISGSFREKIAQAAEVRFNAPEIVQPGGGQTIAESLGQLEKSRQMMRELREYFDTVEGTEITFPHPAFGPMTAQDWLALIGGHESRHIEQIEKILESGL
jgi:methyl-accepting chemotaxis protein